jgi:phi LC3 family holin
MKINLKVRLKNKAFLAAMAALLITFIYQILSMFDIVPKISEDSITTVISMVLNILGMLGVIVDPTTASVSDSDRAMTYGTENDESENEKGFNGEV